MFVGMDADERRIWHVNPYRSSEGNTAEALILELVVAVRAVGVEARGDLL